MAEGSNPVAKSLEASLRLDFYGSLLTERSRRLLELHFDEDLSYGEIAEELGISRQGVHDGVSRGLAQLAEYEKKLGLVERSRIQRLRLEESLRLIALDREAEAENELHKLLDEL
jgi:uncharacterized protein